MKLFLLTTCGLLFLLVAGQAPAQDKKGFRLIDVPARADGYRSLKPLFKTQLIESQEAIDAFVKQIEGRDGGKDRDAFLKALTKALTNAKLDFTKESLVLIGHLELTGPSKASLTSAEVKDEKLVFVIQLEFGDLITTAPAQYCFAGAVEKGKVKEVEIWLSTKGAGKEKKPREVLLLRAEPPKLAFRQDGEDLVVTTRITINGSEHVLLTNSAKTGRLNRGVEAVTLRYCVIQNGDRLVRHQKTVDIEWRLNKHTKGQEDYQVKDQVLFLNTAELQRLGDQVKKLTGKQE